MVEQIWSIERQCERFARRLVSDLVLNEAAGV